MSQFVPCEASVLLGALSSEVANQFKSKKFRKEWLDKIGVKVITAKATDEGPATTAWVLPDGAGVQFPTEASVEHMQQAAYALVQHVAGEIWAAKHNLPPTELEFANQPNEITEEMIAEAQNRLVDTEDDIDVTGAPV